MSSILEKQVVVKLNKHWQAFEIFTVSEAVTFLCSESGGEKPGFAMDYETAIDENGKRTLVYANPVDWETWMTLPVREGDLSIGIGPDPVTGQPRALRMPLVVICAKYDALPKKSTNWSPSAVRARDKGICQVSNRKLAPHEGNTGHILARSKGGKNSFENTIYMDKRLNTLQGTKTPEEMGWRLAKKPTAPKAQTRVLTAEDAKDPSQLPFLI
jgi:hypothetical protein